MELINLTGHDVAARVGSDMEWVIKSCGSEARVFSEQKKAGFITDSVTNASIRVVQQIKRRAVLVPLRPPRKESPFPEPQPDTMYIVSIVVREFLSDRMDLISPDGGKTAERENGVVLCVNQFRMNSKEK